jgi:nitrogen fixation protein NifZ
VRVIRNIHNDGTFPGATKGILLVRRGSVGYVRDVGTFLQDQIIYSVDFLASGRLVGCREQELLPVETPWNDSRFEFREKVFTVSTLAIDGRIVVPADTVGEVFKVLRNAPGEVHYQCAIQRTYLSGSRNGAEVVRGSRNSNVIRCTLLLPNAQRPPCSKSAGLLTLTPGVFKTCV